MKKRIPQKGLVLLGMIVMQQLVWAQGNSWKPEAERIPDKTKRIEWIIEAAKKPEYKESGPQMAEMALRLCGELSIDSSKGKANYLIGKYYQRTGDISTSWNYYQKAKVIYGRIRNYNEVCNVLYSQTQLLLHQHLPDSMMHFLDKNAPFIRLATDEKIKLYLKSMHAAAYLAADKKDMAFEEFSKLLPIAIERNDTQMIISTYINLGMTSHTFDSTMIWFKKAAVYASTNAPAKYAELLFKIGFAYSAREDGKKDSALYYFQEAEKNIDLFTESLHKLLLYNSMGEFFANKQEQEFALSYFRKAYAYSSGKMGRAGALVLNNLALTFIHLNQVDSSNYYLKLFRNEIEKTQDDYLFLLYYQTRTVQATQRGDSCSAEVLQLYKTAIEYAVKTGNTRHGAELLQDVMRCMLQQPLNNKTSADIAHSVLLNAEQIYEMLKEESNLGRLAKVLEYYAPMEARFGSKEKALALYKTLAQTLTKMNEEQYLKGLDEALIRYKSDLKDTEIALLTERNNAARVRTRLTAGGLAILLLLSVSIFWLYKRENRNRHLLDERNHKVEQLLREVHHRVKNNLQIVSSFINIQLDKVKDREGREALRDTSTRILALAGLHQSLYRQGNLARIQLDAYISELCSAIGQNAASNIRIDCELERLELDIDKAIPIGLAVNELITNALKHAFGPGQAGHITVRLKKEKEWQLIVQDDGKGLPENMQPRQLQSIGIRLVQDITERQLNGIFSFYNAGGAMFKMSFPQPVS